MRIFTRRATVAAAAGAIALGTVGLTPAAADGIPVPTRPPAPQAYPYDNEPEEYQAQPPAAYQYPAPPPVNDGYAYPPAYYPGVARPYIAGPGPGFIAPPYRRYPYAGPVYGRQVYGGPVYGRPFYGPRGNWRHHW